MDQLRRNDGRETWHRLRDWDRGSTESERLAARLLPFDGFEGIDPAHPRGGPDGGKDILCKRAEKKWLAAVYFPHGQRAKSAIKKKFSEDCRKAKELKVDGMVFVTNQELTLALREEFSKTAAPMACEIWHIECVAAMLDTPKGYGLRLEFLSIEMTKEEQVSHFNALGDRLSEIDVKVSSLVEKKKASRGIKTVSVDSHAYEEYASTSLFPSKLMECRECGEVFRASKNTITVMPSYWSTISNSLETVKCPACGKVQAYH